MHHLFDVIRISYRSPVKSVDDDYHRYAQLIGTRLRVQRSKANMFMHASMMTPVCTAAYFRWQDDRWRSVNSWFQLYVNMFKPAINNDWSCFDLSYITDQQATIRKHGKKNTLEFLSHASKLEIESRQIPGDVQKGFSDSIQFPKNINVL